MFALVDCNNFFVSCERVFQPKYNNRPVVVLSNNDGCIVSRSQEAKKLGIPMAGAYFKVRYIAEQNGVVAFSSNFALYADLSRRVQAILGEVCDRVEHYSVDEAFLEFPDTTNDIEGLAQEIADVVPQWTAIPVSVGIAATKTLAKVATDRAKKDPHSGGICSLMHKTEEELDAILDEIPVTDVWGIGFRQGPLLLQQGIRTARDLKHTPEWLIRKQLTVHGARTVRELRGEVCFPLTFRRDKKSIASTRSFRRYIHKKHELAEAVANYTARAASKLRSQQCHAGTVTVFIRTNHHSKGHPQYHNTATRHVTLPTSSTPRLTEVALEALDAIYQEGFAYQKAGVVLSHIVPGHIWQGTLWPGDHAVMEHDDELMRCMDRLNQRWGERTVFLAKQGIERTWRAREDFRSPRFTTSWQELPNVKIG